MVFVANKLELHGCNYDCVTVHFAHLVVAGSRAGCKVELQSKVHEVFTIT